MKVTNKASFPVFAFCWSKIIGDPKDTAEYGDDATVLPGETKEILGPCLGAEDGGEIHAYSKANVVCHEGTDSGNHLHIAFGNPAIYGSKTKGVIIRHHHEDRVNAIRTDFFPA